MPPKALPPAQKPTFVPIETPRITRAAARRGDGNAKLPMGINCVCGHNFLNSSDSLMYCEKCSFWSHRKCVGMASKSSAEILKIKFVCPMCTGEAFKRPRNGDSTAAGSSANSSNSSSISKTSNRIKLEEVPDKPPQASVAALIRSTMAMLLEDLRTNSDIELEFVPPLTATTMMPQYPPMDDDAEEVDAVGPTDAPITIVSPTTPILTTPVIRRGSASRSTSTGTTTTTTAKTTAAAVAAAAFAEGTAPHEHPAFPKRLANVLTDATIKECLECCDSAIKNATFSESYPDYCLKELQAFPQKYLQGVFARDIQSKKVVAFVLSNGMDEYGNLKPNVTQLKATYAKQTNLHTPWMEECLKINDFNDFVHITLIATHEKHRGKKLAKKLMLSDALRWVLRGRSRAYLNMALERLKVPAKSGNPDEEDVVCVAAEASRRLYTSMGFADVIPSRVDPETNEVKWTPKEEEGGKVMANLDLKEASRNVSRSLLGDTAPLYSGRKVLKLKK